MLNRTLPRVAANVSVRCAVTLCVCLSIVACSSGGSSGGGNRFPTVALVAEREVLEDDEIIVDLSDFATDDDGDPLTFTATGTAGSGTLEVIDATTVRYRPQPDFNGTDTVNFTVDDGRGGVVTGSVPIRVLPVNDAPAASDDSRATAPGVVVEVPVLANDSDVDDPISALSITAVTTPSSGLVEIIAGGTSIRFTPDGASCGPVTFDYTVTDGSLSTTATATVEVLCVELLLGADEGNDLPYEFESGVGSTDVDFTLVDVGSAGGLSTSSVTFSFRVPHGITIASAAPGTDAAAAGATIVFDAAASEPTATVTFASPFDLSADRSLVVLTIETEASLLRGNRTGDDFTVECTAATAVIQGAEVPAVLTGTSVTALPNFPTPAWLGLLAPGGVVTFPEGDPEASFTRSIELLDIPVGDPSEIDAFSFGFAHGDGVSLFDATIGADVAALNAGDGPEFLVINLLPDAFTLGCLVSIEFTDLLIADVGAEIVVVTYEIDIPAVTAAGGTLDSAASFDPSFGSPPVANVVAVEGRTIVPEEVVGVIRIEAVPVVPAP